MTKIFDNTRVKSDVMQARRILRILVYSEFLNETHWDFTKSFENFFNTGGSTD